MDSSKDILSGLLYSKYEVIRVREIMRKIIHRLPVPIAGLMLGLASTGILFSSVSMISKSILGCLAFIILVLLIVKIFSMPKEIREELKNPAIAGMAPAFSMGVIVLASYVQPFYPSAALGMWLIGILLHASLILFFTKKLLAGWTIYKIFPSCFILYVGITTGSLTAPLFNAVEIGKGLFWFGLAAYGVLLPLIVYRVFIIKAIPEALLPTLTIFAAPASLCLAGYLSAFQEKNMLIVWLLMILSIIMLLAVLLYMPKMVSRTFHPSSSAFTFPVVISAIALKNADVYLMKIQQGIAGLKYFVWAEEGIAVIFLLYVFTRYIIFIFFSNAHTGWGNPRQSAGM